MQLNLVRSNLIVLDKKEAALPINAKDEFSDAWPQSRPYYKGRDEEIELSEKEGYYNVYLEVPNTEELESIGFQTVEKRSPSRESLLVGIKYQGSPILAYEFELVQPVNKSKDIIIDRNNSNYDEGILTVQIPKRRATQLEEIDRGISEHREYSSPISVALHSNLERGRVAVLNCTYALEVEIGVNDLKNVHPRIRERLGDAMTVDTLLHATDDVRIISEERHHRISIDLDTKDSQSTTYEFQLTGTGENTVAVDFFYDGHRLTTLELELQGRESNQHVYSAR